ncbi:type II secretion system protein XpsN [Pseudoxanthomonas mexicana]
MRRESWNARTWILAAVAGWAVLAALLALFGLGGRIVPLPADPALVQALPKLPANPPERLGALAQYAEVGERPLFSEDRRPKPFFLSGDDAAAPTFDLVLSSVLITPSLRLAILQPAQGGEGLRVKLGEAPAGFAGWQLVELEPRRAVFDGPEGRRELELRVFDGSGGQAPTAMTPGAPAAVPMVPPGGMGAPRSTGGNQPPVAMPGGPATTPKPTSVATAEVPVEATAPPEPAANTDQQMEAIRQRIEQRRAQLRQQQAQPTTPPAPPGKTQ